MYIVLEIIGLLIEIIIYKIIVIYLILPLVFSTAGTLNFARDLIRIFGITTVHLLVVANVIAFALIALKAYFLLCINSYLEELIKLKIARKLSTCENGFY